MPRPIRTVAEYEQVGNLLKVLRTTSHHGFPVAARGGGGGVLGIILRDQLMTILSHRRFEPRRSASPHLGSYFGQHSGPHSQRPPLSADESLRPWDQTSIEQL
jgi:CBS domain.